MKKCNRNEIETDARILSTPSCAIWCKDGGFTPHPLTYDGDGDGTPDLVTSTGNTITITPTDLSFHECDSNVTYVLQNEISGVSLDPNTAVISIDCTIASQTSCDLTLLIDTICNSTVIGTRSMNLVLTCGDCAEDTNTHLDYDGNDDLVPDNVVIDGDIVTITPVDLSVGECPDEVRYHITDPTFGISLDEITGVVTIDCTRVNTDSCDLELVIDVNCFDTNTNQTTFMYTTVLTYTLPCDGCQNNGTPLDYDGDDDGIPDNVTVDGDITTVTPVDVSDGECPNGDVTYEFAEDYGDAFVLDTNTAVYTIDCNKLDVADCNKMLTINAICAGNVLYGTQTVAPTQACKNCRSLNGVPLDYDVDDDGVPDDVTVNGDTISVIPVQLSENECTNGDVTYVLFEDYGPAFTIDNVTGVVSIDCAQLATADCNRNITVKTLCAGNDVSATNFNAPTGSCASCGNNGTDLDYDANDDGTPDTITTNGDIITITPVDLDTGNCNDGDITYELATPVPGVTIDTNTAVISIDCSQVQADVCTLDLTINTICTPH